MLSSYTSLHQELVKVSPLIFTTLIITQYTNLVACQILRPCLITTKGAEDIRLLGDEVYRRETGVIIDESDPIQVATPAVNRQRAMHIGKYTKQRTIRPHCWLGMWGTSELPIDTIFTEVVRRCAGDMIREAFNRPIVTKAFDG